MDTVDQRLEMLNNDHISIDNEDYFDGLYDTMDDEKEERSDHSLLIFHLASQLLVNMDISKLSLPICLCEKRSILETYSDYFSCTNLWLNICEFNSAKERMVACLKWYLSIFNASRKSKLARKPYNPILGEVFKCKFKVLNNSQERFVSYISEQVSHHPPILAFHVEDDLKQLSLTSRINLKSKFLGFSVSIDMVGEARLTLLNKEDEEYIITFPKVFCNSIYTTPWLELSGKTKISCGKSGYEAVIHFKRQGYISGCRDRIEANIFHKGVKEAIYSVKGIWSGIMTIKDINSEKEQTFINVLKVPLIKATVLPRSKQNNFESRKVWEDVTKHLKNKDIIAATDARNKIEQEQRNELTYRITNNIEWKLRHFEKNGDFYEFKKY